MTALTPQPVDRWISAETEQKENDFRGIVAMHLRICKAILSRGANKPYLYADLHAGPGHLTYGGRSFDGSPLVFLRLAAEVGVHHQSLFFDQDVTVAGRLSASMSWLETNGSTEVVAEACETGMTKWLAAAGVQPWRYGLVYADPIGKEIPVALDKRFVYVRQPSGQWQWTFVLWTNFESRLDWKRAGFHRTDSPRGRLILDRLDLTRREFHEATNEPLPLFNAPGGAR